jgi:hypothetical protein
MRNGVEDNRQVEASQYVDYCVPQSADPPVIKSLLYGDDTIDQRVRYGQLLRISPGAHYNAGIGELPPNCGDHRREQKEIAKLVMLLDE